MSLALIVYEKSVNLPFLTFDLDLFNLDKAKVIVLYMMGSVLSQSTFVSNLVTVVSIVSEKYGKVTFCDL